MASPLKGLTVTVFCMTDSLGLFHRRLPRRTTLAAILATGALGLAGCSSGLSTEPSGKSPATAGPLQAATLGETGGDSPGAADVSRKTARPDAPAQLMVESVRVARHEGFDRVVFDMVGDGEPGWFMDYTTTPAQQGSGKPIPFEGTAALNVHIDGTAYPFELNREDPQIGIVPGAGNITHVISAGTFEGHSQFVVSMEEQRPYTVDVLHEPHRLVIDVLRP